MLNLNIKLKKLEEENKKIKVGVIGAGQMGTGLVSQMLSIKGMLPIVVVDRTLTKARNAYVLAGVNPDDIVATNKVTEAERAINKGKFVISDNVEIATYPLPIDVVVDATGNPESGAQIALYSIYNKKHIVMLNVEADATIGPILKKMAKTAGVVYTVSAGDEPGAIKELYDFADAMGFEIIAAGKGKNNPLDRYVTPEKIVDQAKAKGVNPRMLSSFIDGTNTMIEMTCVSNSLGFVPSKRGMTGVKATLSELPKLFSLKEEGGILDRFNVLEYVYGIAPGVFVIIRTDNEIVRKELKYVSMGEGPSYVLYRPYHLASLETPLSVARAYFYNEATMAPTSSISDTVTFAKRDLRAGECLDNIGSSKVYGLIDTIQNVKKENALPIGLANSKVKLKKDIKKDGIITYDDVELDESSIVLQLRKLQDKLVSLKK